MDFPGIRIGHPEVQESRDKQVQTDDSGLVVICEQEAEARKAKVMQEASTSSLPSHKKGELYADLMSTIMYEEM